MSAPFFSDLDASLYVGDSREVLASLPESSARTCVTSPPYWGLRDYGVAGQIGAERTPAEYVANLVSVFREVRRALADDGTLWLNLGDSYAGRAGGGQGKNGQRADRSFTARVQAKGGDGLKNKDLVGIPWRVALALQEDGWYLRSDIIWSKSNPMPSSVKDRPTSAHEYVFLLAKSERYFYDAAAIAEPVVSERGSGNGFARPHRISVGGRGREDQWVPPDDGKRNARSVWSIATQPSGIEHFAMMPPELARRCVLAGSAPGDVVLDPFNGAGTTGIVAMRHGRRYLGVELNPRYADASVERWRGQQRPLFAEGSRV